MTRVSLEASVKLSADVSSLQFTCVLGSDWQVTLAVTVDPVVFCTVSV